MNNGGVYGVALTGPQHCSHASAPRGVLRVLVVKIPWAEVRETGPRGLLTEGAAPERTSSTVQGLERQCAGLGTRRADWAGLRLSQRPSELASS